MGSVIRPVLAGEIVKGLAGREVIPGVRHYRVPLALLDGGDPEIPLTLPEGEPASFATVGLGPYNTRVYELRPNDTISIHINRRYGAQTDVPGSVYPAVIGAYLPGPIRSMTVVPGATGTPGRDLDIWTFTNIAPTELIALLPILQAIEEALVLPPTTVDTAAIALTGTTRVLILAESATRQRWHLAGKTPTVDIFIGDDTVTNVSTLATCGLLVAEANVGPYFAGPFTSQSEIYAICSAAFTDNIFIYREP